MITADFLRLELQSVREPTQLAERDQSKSLEGIM